MGVRRGTSNDPTFHVTRATSHVDVDVNVPRSTFSPIREVRVRLRVIVAGRRECGDGRRRSSGAGTSRLRCAWSVIVGVSEGVRKRADPDSDLDCDCDCDPDPDPDPDTDPDTDTDSDPDTGKKRAVTTISTPGGDCPFFGRRVSWVPSRNNAIQDNRPVDP